MTPVLDLNGHVVGRRQELIRLEGILEAAERHGGECAMLSGVPGVGKSTLMQAFDGGVSVATACSPTGGTRNRFG